MSQNSFSLKSAIVGTLVLIVLGYAAFNTRFIIQGPEIVLENGNEDSIVTKDKTLFLKGKILHSSFITINGRPIFVDESGNFNEKLLLSSGVSIIDIYAKDKFGKEVRKKIDVLYEGQVSDVDFARLTSVAMAEASASTTSSSGPTLARTQADTEATSTSDTLIEETMRMSMMSTSTTAGH